MKIRRHWLLNILRFINFIVENNLIPEERIWSQQDEASLTTLTYLPKFFIKLWRQLLTISIPHFTYMYILHSRE